MENQDDYHSTLEELEAARNQLSNYQSLLQDLPELYERKFEERLRPIRDRNRALGQEGEGLRQQLDRALPAAHQPQHPGLPAATEAPKAAESRPTADTPVVPRSRSRTLLPLGMAGAASLFLLATFAPPANWMRYFSPTPPRSLAGSEAKTEGSTHSWAHQPLPRPPATRTLTPTDRKQPAPVSMAAPGELILTTSAPTWLEVRDADDHPLMAETFQGQRRIPLGQGLRLLAGRPDLITIQLPGTLPRRLGNIHAVDWQTIKPPEPHPVRASHRTAVPATRPSLPSVRSVNPTLLVKASETSWIQVRGINRDAIYAGLLNGQRRFPLGRGLEMRSGRADAVSVAIDQAVPKPLGTIDDLGWHRFTPPASRPSLSAPISPLPPNQTQPTSSKPMGAKPQASVSLWDSLGIPPSSLPRNPPIGNPPWWWPDQWQSAMNTTPQPKR